MFINPKIAIEKGWIKFPNWMDENFRNKCIQPNAIDFTLDKVFTVSVNDDFVISETTKKMRGNSILEPRVMTLMSGQQRFDGQPGWELCDGLYDCLSDFYVDLPDGVAAMLVPRSTFVRNGLFWTSGLYDSGFKGHIGGILHNRAGVACIKPNTRVGQIIFIQSDSAGLYSGGWNHDAGTNAGHQT